MRNGMVGWVGAVGVAVAIAACGGHPGGPGSGNVSPPPLPGGQVAQHVLVVSKSGSGSVRSAPAGIDCGAACSAVLAEGTEVVLTPSPDAGWRFAGWGGGCSGLGGCAVRLAADTKVFVTFETLPPPPAGKHNVAVTSSGAGAGRISSSPAGIDCGASCSAPFDDGVTVVLNARPAQGSTFAGWSGACSGIATTCTVAVTSDLQIGAAFDGKSNPPPALSGWVSPAGDGKSAAAVMALATDSAGNTVELLLDSSAPQPVGLRKLNSAGKELWTRFFPGSGGQDVDPATVLATDGDGDVYLMWASMCGNSGCNGNVDFGDGATPAAAVVKFDPDGNLLWEKRLSENGAKLSVNPKGEAVFRSWRSADAPTSDVVRVSADGSQVWSMSSRGLGELTIDADGNVVVGAFTSQSDPIFGQSFASDGPVVAKLASADGSLVWAKRVAEGTLGDLQALGVDGSGAIVAAGRMGGIFDFGGQHFDTAGNPVSALLFVYEPDGKERLARALPDTDAVLLAVHPSGHLSLLGMQTATSAWVALYDLAGTKLGSANLQATGALHVNSIAVGADHNTMLGGFFTGTVDFGSGPVTAQAQEGFAANLGK